MIAPRNFLPQEASQRPWEAHYPAEVPVSLHYPQRPLPFLLEHTAAKFPDRVVCHYYSQHLTYSQLLHSARRFAAMLIREGVQPGDRVGILLPNLPEYLISLFGTWMAGGVVVALSPMNPREAISSLVAKSECKVIVSLDVLAPLMEHLEHQPELVLLTSLNDRLSWLERIGYAWVRFQRLGFGKPCPGMRVMDFNEALKSSPELVVSVAVDPEEPAYILPTGGTTGAPKAVLLSHKNLMANAWQLRHWSMGEAGAETMLAVLPFFHSYGLSACVLNGIAMGATLVLQHRFSPAGAIRLIEQYKPTILLAVPAMLTAFIKEIRQHKHDLHSLKVCISGGAPLPKSVAEEFSALTGCTVVEGYGLSEASPVTHAGPLDGTAVPGTIGLPLPDTEARIVDAATGTEQLPHGEVGELIVRGPQVMLGYWKNPTETERVLRNGWLHTGDLGTCDENGFFRIVDRKKDLIITSGFNVYPADVESVLRNYPGVQDAAVVGVPNDDTGETVKAILVLESGHKFNRRDFDEFTHRHLSAQQRPKLVEAQSADLPRNFLGKVLRRELREEGAKAAEPLASAAP